MLGKTGAGKSSALRHIVEHLLGQKKRVVIIDPKGDWWGLKTAADGKGPGFPVIMFGDFKESRAADVPITKESGKHIAELVAAGNRPCVIGFRGWSTHHMQIFWLAFAEALFAKNAGELFIVGDEFHNFAPKGKVLSPQAGESLHWSNRLLSEGRGLGLVCLLASQRPQKVHNDTLTSCETLVAMRVIHKADRDAVKDWIDGAGDAELGKQVLNSLAGMPRGQAYIWSPEIEFGPKLVTFPMFTTFDSFAPPQLQKKVSSKGWSGVDLDDVKKKLATVIEEAKANDPAELKKQIQELQKKLKAQPAIDPDAQRIINELRAQVNIFEQAAKEHEAAVQRAVAAATAGMKAQLAQCEKVSREIVKLLGTLNFELPAIDQAKLVANSRKPIPARVTEQVTKAIARHVTGTGTAELSRMERALLTAIAQHPEGLSKGQVLLHAHYRQSGDTSSAFAKFAANQWIEGQGKLTLTAAGSEALGPFEPLPTGEDLREKILTDCNTMHRALLNVIFDAHPNALRKGEVLEQAGYKQSGDTSSAFAKFRQIGWITVTPQGVRASDQLFN